MAAEPQREEENLPKPTEEEERKEGEEESEESDESEESEDDGEEERKMVLVVRTDLGMTKGKMCSQVLSHSLSSFPPLSFSPCLFLSLPSLPSLSHACFLLSSGSFFLHLFSFIFLSLFLPFSVDMLPSVRMKNQVCGG